MISSSTSTSLVKCVLNFGLVQEELDVANQIAEWSLHQTVIVA